MSEVIERIAQSIGLDKISIRCVLGMLLEPNEAMIEHGVDAMLMDERTPTARECVIEIYQAMIKAALDEA